MGVADRVRKHQLLKEAQGAESPTGIQSTEMVLAEPPHIIRLKGVVRMLSNIIAQNDDGSGLGKLSFFMTTLTDELAEELAELDEIHVRLYLFQIGEVISWIGHGDNERLPDSVKEFADLIGGKSNATNTPREASSHTELDSGSR